MSTYPPLLVLTDHSGHSAENSLYALVRALRRHAGGARIMVASRGDARNASFFAKGKRQKLYASEVAEDFAWRADGAFITAAARPVDASDFAAVWLRLPPPLDRSFLRRMAERFNGKYVFNRPAGIWETGSKAFLTNFPDLCPPLHLCRTVADIEAFSARFPIVLKPLRNYGGRGLLRIDGDRAWKGSQRVKAADLLDELGRQPLPLDYLGVKYLRNVKAGDKRIVVVDGRIMGASLRLPAADSWLCNVAAGGRSQSATVDGDERRIVEAVHPLLADLGVLMYGIDTLLGDDGKRCLSELNTTSIGGIVQLDAGSDRPVLAATAQLIWNAILRNT